MHHLVSARTAGHAGQDAGFLSALFDAASDAIVGLDLDGRIRCWNRGAERLFGFAADELIGEPMLRTVPVAWQAQAAQAESSLARGECPPPFDTERLRKDGTSIAVSLTVSPMRDAQGRLIGSSHIARALTRPADTRLEQAAARHAALLQATHAVVWTCPPSGLHVEPQPLWMAFTGQTADQMLGAGWVQAVHPDDVPAATARWAAAVSGGRPMYSEHRIRRHDGQWRWMSVYAAPIHGPAGRVDEWFGICLDITDRRLRLQALEERSRELGLLARCSRLLLAPRQDGALRVESVLTEISRTVGAEICLHHEAADAGSLRLRSSSGLGDADRERFHTVRHGDLLFGRVAVRRRPLIVEDLANTDFPGGESMRTAGFQAYAGFPLIADDRLLGTVAFITRARTHFSEGEAQVMQSLCDQVAAVLERERLLAALRDSEERLLQARDANGAARTATDPGRPPQTALPHPPLRPQRAGAAARRLLVVDDDVDAAASIARRLQRAGHEVAVAHDGWAALAAIETNGPDIVLLDIGLPLLDGYEVARRIAAQPATARRPRIVAVSDVGHDLDRERAAGFDAHLVKPIDLAALAQVLAAGGPPD